MAVSNAKTSATTNTADREIVITRVFDAPRDLVFKAWTDPEHLVRWYAPKDCTLHIYKFDFRTGGAFQTSLRNPKSRDCLCSGIYQEIVAPERLVYSLFFSDEDGNFVEPAQAGMDSDWPQETKVTVTFAEQEGKTRVTLHQTVLESIAKRTGAYPSWIEMLDRLAGELAAICAS